MSKNYEVYFTNPDSPMRLEQWLESLLEDNRELVTFSNGYWIFRIIEHLSEMECTIDNTVNSYGKFYDMAVIALGFSSAELPCDEMNNKMLKKISDLFWLNNKLYESLKYIYRNLPRDFRCLPFSFDDLEQRYERLTKIRGANADH